MTTTARELFEEWYSMCSFNSGDTKYACSEAWRQAYERGRESVLDNFPSALDMWSLAMQCKKAAEQEPMGDVKLFRLKLLAKLKEPV